PSPQIAQGELNRAALPVPFVEPEGPFPATVTTAKVESCRDRIALLPLSAMNSSVPSPQRPFGLQNFALVPVASIRPETPTLPAIVQTCPFAMEILRIVWLPVSLT